MEKTRQIPIWFFIGGLLLAIGLVYTVKYWPWRPDAVK